MIIHFLHIHRNRHRKAHHHRTSHHSKNDDSHGGRSDRTAKTQPIHRVVFGCFCFIGENQYRCRSPPHLRFLKKISNERLKGNEKNKYKNFFLGGQIWLSNMLK